jgi:hypothetical protein
MPGAMMYTIRARVKRRLGFGITRSAVTAWTNHPRSAPSLAKDSNRRPKTNGGVFFKEILGDRKPESPNNEAAD